MQRTLTPALFQREREILHQPPPCVDLKLLQLPVLVAPPDDVLQIHAGTDVVGDHRHPFADLGAAAAGSNIDLAVLLAEPRNAGLWILDNVAVPAVGSRSTTIA